LYKHASARIINKLRKENLIDSRNKNLPQLRMAGTN